MKSFLLVVFLLLGYHLFAQNTDQRYIEFQVTDSVRMVPEKLMYTITLNRYAFIAYNPYDANVGDDPGTRVSEATQKMEQADARLQKLFRDMKLIPVNHQGSPALAVFGAQETVKSYTLEFKSVEALSKFETKMKEIEKVNGYVSEMTVTDKQLKAARERLMAKIALRAKAEGEMMTSKFGTGLGNILSIKADPERMTGTGFNSYGMYGELAYETEEDFPGAMARNPKDMMQDMYMTVTVRYELK